MTERPVVIAFRRSAFYGDFRAQTPKWHLLRGDDPGKWGTYTAWCGYSRTNILGDLTVSRSKTPKPAKDSCGKCVTALTKHNVRAAAQADSGSR